MVTEITVTQPNQSVLEERQPVQADLMVLAAGLWPDTGNARLTLQIEPRPVGEPSAFYGDALTLETWPSSITSRLGGKVTLTFLKLTATEAKKCPDPAQVASGPQVMTADVLGLAAAGAQTSQDATKLWQNMLAKGPEVPNLRAPTTAMITQGTWQDLTLSLKLSQANKGVSGSSSLENGNGAVPELANKEFGADGQIKSRRAKSETEISGILSVPHSDLALALDQQRVEELCVSLAEACGQQGAHAEQEKERRGALKPDPCLAKLGKLLDRKEPPTNDEIKAVCEEYVDITALWKPDATEDDKKAALERLRRSLKKKERKALSSVLQASRKVNSNAYREEQERLKQGKCDDKDPDPPKPLCGSDAHVQSIREAAMQRACAAHHYSSWPQYAAKDEAPADVGEDKRPTETAIVQRYAALKSDPVLARLVGLSMDVEVAASDFQELKNGFYLVTAQPGANQGAVAPGEGATWTLLEVSGPSNAKRFWPATERAALLGLGGTSGSVPRQSHGLIALSQGACGDTGDVPRFDLTSLELRSATEAEMQRRLARQSNVDAKAATADEAEESDTLPEADDLSLGAKYLTGGLTLLMRSAGTDTAIRLARRRERLNGPDTILDAEDLTTGVRPFIGTPMAPKEGNTLATNWSSLTARDIEYGTSGEKRREVKDLLRKVFPAGKMAVLQRDLQAGFFTSPSRLLPTGEDAQEAVIDEAITTWDGSPMGVDVTSLDNDVCDVHVFGRKMTLPRKRMDTLRFGVPYRFALAAVYSGGMSRQPESLPSIQTPDENSALYPAPAQGVESETVAPFFRFLRHEKIAAPEFALPLGHALRSKGQTRNNGNGFGRNPLPHVFAGPMGFDSGPRMVVRSLGPYVGNDNGGYDARMKARATPDICHRVVLVPSIPFDCAEWHGAFDGVDQDRPIGSYDYLAGSRAKKLDPIERENLIVTRTNLQKGISNRGFVETRTYTDFPNDALSSDTVTLGDAIAKQPEKIDGRKPGNLRNERSLNRYYEDPLAERLAFGIRLAGETEYLAGCPIIYDVSDVPVNLAGGRKNYSRLPVVVTTKIEPGPPRSSLKKITDIVSVKNDSTYQWFNADSEGDGFTGPNRYLATFELRLNLRAGEAVEIDVWALPAKDSLAREHALVQALGAKLFQEGKAPGLTDTQAILAAAKKCLPGRFADELSMQLNASTKGASTVPAARQYVAPGGRAAPSNGALKALGKTITKMLECGPLPELVGKTTLSAVHAANRVSVKPESLSPAQPQDPIETQLPPLEDAKARPVRAARPANLDGATTDPLVVTAPGSTHFVLDGTVPFESNVHDIVEIEAQVTLPGTSVFDDSNRGRSVARRREGTWPPLRNLDGGIRVDKDKNTIYRSAEDLFGFDVSRDGSVGFSPAKVTLLRAEGLPRDLPNGLLDLRALFLDDMPGVRIAHRHVFPDGKARRMTVQVNALSRTLEDLRTTSRVARSNDPWTGPGEGRVYGTGEHIPAEFVPAKHQANRSDKVEIILPATIRPAKPNAKAPVPLLEEETGASKPGDGRWIWHNRRSSLRIPLGREWFSSGEDESVGIVLWPPTFEDFDPKQKKITKGAPLVQIEDKYEAGAKRVINLEDIGGVGVMFSDDDLGPGGKFVSRRGSDPVRGGSEREPVLSCSAIADIMRDQNDVRRAHFIENVLMPLDDEGKDQTEGKKTPLPPMRVALALYEPRFDVEREEWYIDVTLDAPAAADGFVRLGLVRYQPHAIPELRCSRPVVQWAQPLSERKLRARQHDNGGIYMEVEGVAAQEKALPGIVSGDNSLKFGVDRATLYRQPAMRFTLFREWEEQGEIRRVILKRRTNVTLELDKEENSTLDSEKQDQMAPPLADAVLVTPRRLSKQLATWSHTLKRSDYEDRPEDGVLAVLVEEIEHFRPATYSEEPVAAAMDAEWRTEFQEAGPRYSAYVHLKDFSWTNF